MSSDPPVAMSSSSSQTSPSLGTPVHERHWPLDLPGGLPFDRYEHRRLAARDLLVHRIVSKILSPTPDLARALEDCRKHQATTKPAQHCCLYHMQQSRTKAVPNHNFGPMKQHDHCLARDVEVLRKMLVTRSHSEWIFQTYYKPVKPSAANLWLSDLPPQPSRTPALANREPPEGTAVPTVEEEVLDLVRRHYLEMDDACTRLWLQTIQPMQRSSYNTLPKKPSKLGTRIQTAQKRKDWDRQNAREDYKLWYEEDTAHLKAFQARTRTANDHRLYEGGAFLPAFRKPLFSSNAERKQFLHMITPFSKNKFFTEEYDAQRVLEETFPWPGPPAPRPVLHIPSWYSWRQKHNFFRTNGHLPSVPAFDFASNRTGMGLDRDGIWSTARWQGDDGPRGRTVRRGRRRATSEPPHGMFTAARLPVNFNHTREILVFPKMSLATIDRRTRRRSLSRTRIAEMFNWDAVLETPLQKVAKVKSKEKPVISQSKAPSHRQLTDVELIYQRLTQQRLVSLYKEIVSKYDTGQITLTAAKIAAWAGAPTSEARTKPWPQWWLEIDGPTGQAFVGHRGVSMLSRKLGGARIKTEYSPPTTCANCTSGEHATDRCKLPCGYCGAPNKHVRYWHLKEKRLRYWSPNNRQSGQDEDGPSEATKHDNPHMASDCPVAKQNRCKCVPFPQFHVAAKCPVLCSRDCGNHEHPPGHFKHKNAMGCGTRCCMCGMKGHSGTKCKLRRCRCGGEHLGQDCGWHPECRVNGCDRFLCGVHCQLCGLDRTQLEEGAVLVGGRCPSCLARGDAMATEPVCVDDSSRLTDVEAAREPADDEPVTEPGRRRRRRRNKSKPRPTEPKAPQEQKPWYAPLEPRARPVVTSKSGKKSAWNRAETDLPVRIGGCR